MALITRVSRLFRADLHAVLDRIEEPDVLLRQAVREMEEELSRNEQRAKALHHERGRLAGRQTDLQASLSRMDEELDVCFASGNDDLARAVIHRKLEAERLLGALKSKGEALEEDASGLEARLKKHREQLESMRQKTALVAERDMPAGLGEVWPGVDARADFSVRPEDVEVALLKEKQKRSRS